MRAVKFDAYGTPDTLTQVDLPTPVPRADQVLIRVRATTVTSAECGMRQGKPDWGRVIIGLRRPRRGFRVLGLEFAGDIAAVGPAVRQLRVGERVFGFTGFGVGANAEYKCLSERASLTTMPGNVAYTDAAATVDGFTTAWHFLHDLANVQNGQKVLVIGASGSIGTYAIQLAKYLGAVVHGVCSGRNAKLVEELGADRVFDYTVEEFTTSGERYDAIFDVVGGSSFTRCRSVLTPRGCYLPTTNLAVNTLLAAATALIRGPRVRTRMSVDKHAALAALRELLIEDRLQIIIDRTYPLSKIAEAHRHVDSGHKVGNVVITIEDD
ncbi:NAD(P)-dependent alcohol dehydrogenase [Salinispora fenicalii]|uniref:NAD(P)-dependent alcohol dehydrogenase n=1 Tax=Salinispora fenicalii TaxID=1137263 RepID=UPI0004864A9E|nr:NAD(P)-dependent alcohol dehydrogenase [Salinispora fenicalii]